MVLFAGGLVWWLSVQASKSINDPTITVEPQVLWATAVTAGFGALAAILVAYINRPLRHARRVAKETAVTLGRIEDNTTKTGNGWTRELAERLERMEVHLESKIDLVQMAIQTSLDETKERLGDVDTRLGRLEGRYSEHTRKNRREDDV